METMYERIKRMSKEEMCDFIYWVYLNGNKDGKLGIADSVFGFFGCNMLNKNAKEIMPNDNMKDLWNLCE